MLSTAGIRSAKKDTTREPVVLVLDDDTEIEFSHLGTMEVSRAEEIAIRMQRGASTAAMMLWLSKEDRRALTEASLTLLQMGRLGQVLGIRFAPALADLGVANPPYVEGELGDVAHAQGQPVPVGLLHNPGDDDLEDVRMGLSTGHIVVFPQLGTMLFSEAEKIARGMTRKRFYDALSEWISEEDVAAIRAERFTLEEVAALSKALGSQFSEAFTELGLGRVSSDELDLVDVPL